jgi:lysophospholipase
MGNTPYGFLQARDGIRLRYGRWPSPAKSHGSAAVLLGGRAEFMEKYQETIGELNARGFHVFSFDWRGQGLSDRMLPDRTRGYVRAYEDYVNDLKLFVDEIIKPNSGGPLILMAHSMGATIALHYLHRFSLDIQKAVLLSPMIQFYTAPVPYDVARWFCLMLAKLGKAHCNIPSMRRNESYRGGFADNELTHDADRFHRIMLSYQQNPQLSISGVTYGWLAASFEATDAIRHPGFVQQILTPILVVTAGEDRVVNNEATDRLFARLPGSNVVHLSGAYHEILQEKDEFRGRFWRAFDRFFQGRPQ